MLKESSGDDTVQYIPFSPTSIDSLTGDVTESTAYSNTPITLPGRIDFFPTNALRTLAGLDIDFEAVIRLSASHLTNNKITEVNIGDVFILPDSIKKRYVTKVIKTKQSGTSFIEVLVFVSGKIRSRG
jgi:hypothetical protein